MHDSDVLSKPNSHDEWLDKSLKKIDEAINSINTAVNKVDQSLVNMHLSFVTLQERFDAHVVRDDDRFSSILSSMQKDKDDAAAKSERQFEESKERNNWIRTCLTLIGGAVILKILDGILSFLR